MAIGGYQILDLEGKDFVLNSGVKVKGIWDKIEGTNSAFLVEHYSLGNDADSLIEQKAEFVHFVYQNGSFVAGIHGSSSLVAYYITVDDDDTVTFSIT